MLINNKVKQFFGGNYSCNKFTKKHTTIPKEFTNEQTTHGKKKRRKKKTIKEDEYSFAVCPFCRLPLEVIKSGDWWFRNYAKECKHCNALEVKDCPACKRKTWLDKSGVYKHHDKWGCGFEGKRIRREPYNGGL